LHAYISIASYYATQQMQSIFNVKSIMREVNDNWNVCWRI